MCKCHLWHQCLSFTYRLRLIILLS
ncbi:hypothetical protein F383_04601 [Gossypium arboreum]|uniref:Uncharacterized protein n=1 Tax=Gossypium arboreum TaxID=29729 RepID=A0A0B0PSV3_GOSAR|nr:hypothetical protein F383_04601 [Gossypium arboreum]